MPAVVFAFLQAFVELGGWTTGWEVGAASGYEMNYLLQLMPALKARGWVMGRWGDYRITERGKIALALEVGRRSKAIARGERPKLPHVKQYMAAGRKC